MKYFTFNLLFVALLFSSCQGQPAESSTQPEVNASAQASSTATKDTGMEKIVIVTKDGLEMTADKYTNANDKAKWIILCHQARFSRGEYKETALRFLDMGYSCLALDQRSGEAVNDVINETHQRAVKKGIGTEYADALPDIEAAVEYLKSEENATDIMLIGSSYSASLAIIMAAKYPDDIDAVVSFSPGNYFKIDGLDVSDFAKKVTIPTFITSEKGEEKDWKELYNNIPNKDKTYFLPTSAGFHGSKALWSRFEEHVEYWDALLPFMKKHF